MARKARGKSTRIDRAEVANQVHSAAIHILRGLRKQDESSGMSASRLSALSVVVFAGPLTLGDLAAAEQVKPPTMTRLVTGLESDGLVRREIDAEDGRVTRVRATPKGTRVLHAARLRRVALLASRFEALDPREVELLGEAAAILERISRRP
jgi:DNA-binding MarR family transcriptional regulator